MNDAGAVIIAAAIIYVNQPKQSTTQCAETALRLHDAVRREVRE